MTLPPPTFGTVDQARAYIARVSSRSRTRTSPEGGARLYLIAGPGAEHGAGWGKFLMVLADRFPGARFVTYFDLFGAGSGRGDVDVSERVPVIDAAADGAIVIARRWINNFGEGEPGNGDIRYLMGYAAKLEADALAELGMPVLLLTPSGAVVTWADVRPHPAERAPAWVRIEVDMPAPDPAQMLPTTAMSYRALGITPPPPRRPKGRPRAAEGRQGDDGAARRGERQ